ncbi:MAG: YnbE family lipoprotein [Oceanospirillaceae bacterium]|nr:YnbE family lipoprotein [Oceanospirillaceae bacterium]|tara:strand:- start:5402 stop:5584 length:183 start_codon:yes stop_codon:yes gene_type:complete
MHRLSLPIVLSVLAISGCTVKLAAPEKPITINLNVKIEHEVRVKVEKDLEQLFEQEDGLF